MNIKILSAAALLALSGTAHAVVMEAGDAGDMIGTTQLLPGGTSMVMGSINPDSDVDMFGFNWGGGAFGATTAGSGIDTQLFLFDAGGNGIVSNDDTAGLTSTVSSILSAGMYFLGISVYNNEPVDVGNNPMFFDNDTGQNLPTGNGPLAGWNGNVLDSGGQYLISFRAPVGAAPEPGIALLLGAGLVGLGLRRRSA